MKPALTSQQSFLERIRIALAQREQSAFLALAIILGALAGLTVVLFRIAIDITRRWLLGPGLYPSHLRSVLAPALAGLLIGLLVTRYFPRSRGSGVTQTKSAVYIYDGYIPLGTVLEKFGLCCLAIGSGHSLGPEDPSLQIGAGLASFLGRKLQFSRERLRLIAPVGAAAGLAAAFNSPIAAVIFIIEEVIGTWTAGILGAVVLSAVSSVVVTRFFLGAEPMFRVPAYTLVHPAELLGYAALGVTGGLSSVVFARLLGSLRPRMIALPRWTRYLQPAVAGLVIGAIGLRFPQIMGAGYDYIDQAMHGDFVWQTLIVLAFLKILATTISLASGTPGGMFAPTLFIGATIGAAVGTLEQHFFPGFAAPIGAYALVGMGALFAGFLRVPMTSVFMVLEVSGNYSIILPVIIANTLAYLISRRLQHVPIFDLLTRQDGLNLPSMEETRERVHLAVENAMQQPASPVFKATQTAASAVAQAKDANIEAFLVSHQNGRWSLIAKSTLRSIDVEKDGAIALGAFVTAERLPRLHPDQPVDLAMRLFHDAPFLPVVHRADATHLLGVLSPDDVLNAYKRLAPV